MAAKRKASPRKKAPAKKAAEKRGRGQPTKYSNKMAVDVCTRIVEGESVREIFRDPKMPSISAHFNWLREHEEYQIMYSAALNMQADYMEHEIIDISDESVNDYMERMDEKGEPTGTYAFCKENVMRSTLRVNTRKWRRNPKKYGDKIHQLVDQTTTSVNANVDISDSDDPQEAAQKYMDMMRAGAGDSD
jgi:hypothetical protein